ncbi:MULTISPECIES: DUF1206 domain-containing protein [Methylobacterium]|uniref:DUF1206 domain-containing protein n=1 Tax=Methylobacterium jeotgali TaxID=381630 RepID=A0ABQ4SW06_9HYPH|nr:MULTISPECIES: DUF1206 domain-containing protein [Methylobacterium]PIU07927.1 MAG: hypothetical protein COT56_03250 [Methylobacterium sp. CG09_land_8_20_14_0_10_71_15]PIU13737.1 MAG: hypothetical protein COT28_10040 [Methylobacterium sp. CG08_land_8_20_14_0_20_71_15]GBU17071.1 hypothetical protein AwMethylo_12860 [Methylobacterium sp.]GJE06658.1 hypothetical protein AOPFMNJM_1980 [Methylobacterium jeotgali]
MSWQLGDNALTHLARVGYGARGTVYCLVGGLAVLAALGRGGQAGDSGSALRTVLHGPFGVVLVGLIALGLAGFAVWRVVEGVTDADRRGRSPKALLVRAGHVVSAVAYAGLALTAGRLAFGIGRASAGGDGVKDWTAWLLSQPLGPWLVGLVGLGVAGTGIGYGVKAWKGDVAERLSLPPAAGDWPCRIGRFGYAARGIAFLIIGGFLLSAAWTQASSEAEGLSGAFRALRSQPYGSVLLAVVAAGHFAFGAFGLIQARYRRIDAPDIGGTDDALASATGKAAEAIRALR